MTSINRITTIAIMATVAVIAIVVGGSTGVEAWNRPQRCDHSVKSGESVWFLSQQRGVSVDEFMRWNNLRSSALDIGQKLRICPPGEKGTSEGSSGSSGSGGGGSKPVTPSSSSQDYCPRDRAQLTGIARSASNGYRPDGRCWFHVFNYINQMGLAGFSGPGSFNRALPGKYSAYAIHFDQFMRANGNAQRYCFADIKDRSDIRRNPYKAPQGAIIVVRPNSPGTSHPYAGDITVAEGDGRRFWNGGSMSYGGSSQWPAGNNQMLGMWMPTACRGECGKMVTQGCRQCVAAVSSNQHCLRGACASAPSSCRQCVATGGGMACAKERCKA
jgi:LysM repeat protein